ncbi:enoyl-CoA hydratase/isomerase family protein [Chloroflexota bacterium]
MTIDYQKEGSTAIFTINYPEVMNALNQERLRELTEAMIDFRDDPSLRIGIITGAGNKAFCAGFDLRGEPSDNIRSESSETPQLTFMRGLKLWKPLIAAINGYAFGGGFEIALACDIRIAADGAELGLTEATLGLMPGWGGTQRLPRIIPYGKAAEMMLTGKRINAQEALKINLVSQVVPQKELINTAKEWAGKISELAPLAVTGIKEAMIRGQSMSLEDGLQLESKILGKIIDSRDAAEGRKAFMEKRKPVYKGE